MSVVKELLDELFQDMPEYGIDVLHLAVKMARPIPMPAVYDILNPESDRHRASRLRKAVEKLLQKGYLERVGDKMFIVSEVGVNVYQQIEELSPSLISGLEKSYDSSIGEYYLRKFERHAIPAAQPHENKEQMPKTKAPRINLKRAGLRHQQEIEEILQYIAPERIGFVVDYLSRLDGSNAPETPKIFSLFKEVVSLYKTKMGIVTSDFYLGLKEIETKDPKFENKLKRFLVSNKNYLITNYGMR